MKFVIDVSDSDLGRLRSFLAPEPAGLVCVSPGPVKVSNTPAEPEATEAELREALISCASRLTATKAKAILKKITGQETASAVSEESYPAVIAALNDAE